MGEAVISLVDGYASESLALRLVVGNGVAQHEWKLHAHDVQFLVRGGLKLNLMRGMLADTIRTPAQRHAACGAQAAWRSTVEFG